MRLILLIKDGPIVFDFSVLVITVVLEGVGGGDLHTFFEKQIWSKSFSIDISLKSNTVY